MNEEINTTARKPYKFIGSIKEFKEYIEKEGILREKEEE